jgi:hypothetical protein
VCGIQHFSKGSYLGLRAPEILLLKIQPAPALLLVLGAECIEHRIVWTRLNGLYFFSGADDATDAVGSAGASGFGAASLGASKTAIFSNNEAISRLKRSFSLLR